MKKALISITAITLLLILVGCEPAEQETTTTTPVQETLTTETITNGVTPDVNIDQSKLDEIDRMEAEEAEKNAAIDAQVEKDSQKLRELAQDGEVSKEDCEVIIDPDFKQDCLQLAELQ